MRTVIRIIQLSEQPRPRVSPTPLGRCARYAESFCGLLDGHAGKTAQFHNIGLGRFMTLQLGQRIVECQQVIRGASVTASTSSKLRRS